MRATQFGIAFRAEDPKTINERLVRSSRHRLERNVAVDADIAIVGGGIIGTTAALALQDAGLRTIVLESGELGTGAAEGSAGYLHDGEIFPLPVPALLAALPRMLFDPLGPLVFRPAYLPRLVGWSAHFLAAMRRSEHEAGIQALAQLNRLAIDMLIEAASAAGARDLIVRGGGLKVCRDERTLAVMAENLRSLQRCGIAAQILDAKALRAIEPSITPEIAGGTFFPDSAHCIDLSALGNRLAARVRSRGAVLPSRARRLLPQSDGSWIVAHGAREQIAAQNVLVAAGHASAELLRPLRYRVPLAPARGYHLMIGDPGVELRHPVIFHDAHFAATPMRNGIRLAGTMEFAAADAPANMQRAEILFTQAQPYLPGLRRRSAATWMGVRPMSPDDLPLLGRAERHPGLYYSFGHGHLGLTQSAISARCIADLVVGSTPPIDLHPFRLSRF